MTKTHSLRIAIVAIATCVTALVGARVAQATPNFPGALSTHLASPRPECAICHNGGVTGRGTVTTPFGMSMRAAGLVAFDEGSLKTALDELAARNTDSLGDGTGDIDDLKAGRDPNVPDGPGAKNVSRDPPEVPGYGCGARVAPGVGILDPGASAALALVGMALLLLRSRRPRTERASGVRRALALVALGAIALAGCGHEPLEVAPHVDLQRFQGTWFEIAKLPRSTQADCTATTARYTLGADGDLVLQNECHLGQPSGPLKTHAMRAKVGDASEPAKLSLDIGGFYGEYWILEVGDDYEYAVVGTPSRASLWILARTRSLDPGTMRGIVDRATAKKFDASRLEYTKQL